MEKIRQKRCNGAPRSFRNNAGYCTISRSSSGISSGSRREIFLLSHGEFISYQDQQNGLAALKERFPGYKQVYSKILQMTLKTLDANFKSFFRSWRTMTGTRDHPVTLEKTIFFTRKYIQSGFKLAVNVLILSHGHSSGTVLAFELPYLTSPAMKSPALVDSYHTPANQAGS